MVFLSLADAGGMGTVLNPLEGDGAVNAGEASIGAAVEVLLQFGLLEGFLTGIADE